TAVAHWRRGGGLHLHYSDIGVAGPDLADDHGRRREDVAVGPDGAEGLQQGIGHRRAGGPATVVHPGEDHARHAIPGQVVGERADGLADLVLVGGRLVPFDEVGLVLREPAYQFLVGQRHVGRLVAIMLGRSPGTA